MKRGILILLFTLLLACSVNADMTSVLVSPDDGLPSADVNSRNVVCKITDKNGTEELTQLQLWFMNNESLPWTGGVPPAQVTSNPTVNTEYTFILDNLVNATYTWNCLATNNESNTVFASSNRTFVITFTTAAPPVTNNPPSCTVADTNITVTEDSGSWTLDDNMSLATNISCADGDTPAGALTYSISSQTGTGGTFSLSSNDGLTFATDANATGTKIAVISVSDGTNTIQVSAQVIVTAVNDPPYLKEPIINRTWYEDATSKIDLDEYFTDIDDSAFNYSYTFTSSSPININVSIKDDGEAVFTPDADWTGTETLTFTAYDSANLSFTSNEVTLTVQERISVNNPPSIDNYDPKTDPTIPLSESQTFKINKSDPDTGDTLSVIWYVDGIIKEGETGDSFVYTPSISGSPFNIMVNVSDGKESITKTWTLTVKTSAGTNQTAPPAEKKAGENVTACGDGNCTGDEDQFSCCKDCGCPEGYTCNKDTGKCTKERKTGNIILLAVVLGLFAGGAGVGLYLYKKKQEKEIFGGIANVPFEPPPKTGEVKKEGLIIKKPQEPVKKAAEEKPLKETKTTSQVLLKNFIITNLKKGKSLEEIKEELRKVGWTEEQINDAYTAAQLDEAFS